MRRLLAIFGGLFGILLVPLALSGPTAWLLVGVHLVFSLLAAGATVLEGWTGHPTRARLWGTFYVVASVAMVAALEFGAGVREAGTVYWAAPWLTALVWGWIPPALAGVSGWIGELRRRRLTRKVRIARKRARLESPPG